MSESFVIVFVVCAADPLMLLPDVVEVAMVIAVGIVILGCCQTRADYRSEIVGSIVIPEGISLCGRFIGGDVGWLIFADEMIDP